MNITVQVDKVTLASTVAEVLGYDEETGETYPQGERTIGDAVAAQIVAAATKDSGRYRALIDNVTSIRAEMIREAIAPQIEQALTSPFRKTNQYGEATGQEGTLRELIIEEAQKAMTREVDGSGYRDRQTFIQKTVAEQVQKALGAEIADAVKAAREQVSKEIGSHVAAAVQAGLRSR